LFASALGAKRVISTDMPAQIQHIERNVDLNRTSLKGDFICIPLLFGQTDSDLRHELQQVGGQDWVIDVIIGADVGYDVSLHEPLAATIKSLLSCNPHRQGIALLVEQGELCITICLMTYVSCLMSDDLCLPVMV
jgi:predicted nicotinamide N-methyase